MKKIDLGQTMSIFANLGVVAGIALLAVELSAVEEFQFTAFYLRGFRVLEWIYRELPTERPRVGLRRVVLQTQISREAWDSEKSVYDPDFVAFMEEGLPRPQ